MAQFWTMTNHVGATVNFPEFLFFIAAKITDTRKRAPVHDREAREPMFLLRVELGSFRGPQSPTVKYDHSQQPRTSEVTDQVFILRDTDVTVVQTAVWRVSGEQQLHKGLHTFFFARRLRGRVKGRMCDPGGSEGVAVVKDTCQTEEIREMVKRSRRRQKKKKNKHTTAQEQKSLQLGGTLLEWCGSDWEIGQ